MSSDLRRCAYSVAPAVQPTRGTTARVIYRDSILNCRPLSPIRILQASHAPFMPNLGSAFSYDTPKTRALHDLDAVLERDDLAEELSNTKKITEKAHKIKGISFRLPTNLVPTCLLFRCAVQDTAFCKPALCQYMASYLPLCCMYLKAESSHTVLVSFQFSSR